MFTTRQIRNVVVGRNEIYTVSDTSTVNGKQETTYENESQYGFALVTISSGETTTYTITSIQEDVEETYTVEIQNLLVLIRRSLRL